MDIKLNQLKNKNTAWICRGITFFLLFLLSFGVVFCYPKFFEHSKSWYPEYDEIRESYRRSEEDWLLRVLLAKNYTFGADSELSKETLFSGFDTYFADNYLNTYDLCYMAADTKNNQLIEAVGSRYVPDENNSYETYTDYGIKITFSYDEKGRLSVPVFEGLLSFSSSYPADLYSTQKSYILQLLYEQQVYYSEEQSFEASDFYTQINSNVSLKNLEITYLLPANVFPHTYYSNHGKGVWALEQSGIFLFFAVFFAAAFLIGCLAPMKAVRFPAELSVLGSIMCMSFTFNTELLYILYEIMAGKAAPAIIENLHLGGITVSFINQLLSAVNVFFWFIMGTVVLLAGHSLRLLFLLKPKEWFLTCTLTGMLCRFIKKLGSRFGCWLLSLLRAVDLSDDMDKKLLKVVSIQFLILGLLSLFWFFGTAGLLIYSVFLFFLLKKYAVDLKEKFQILLSAANEMGEGNLNITITEDLGIFSPLGTSISRIQQGFKKAVEEETKSQQMKTELITNVSHDLKTPLTAIITYINLLKEENITEEERRSYIDTLDKKSLRLKQLIEDLFEVSKANSNNITLHLVEVDLAALIKQAALELEDSIAASHIDFRYQLPDEKITRSLDSEKTYRIIENLMVNITKYALPGSRAYVELTREGEQAVLTMKNISAAELAFSTDEITDRFVRGDKARSTEGSGLGLAIVKSFTELQGGTLSITTDGDLFKVTVVF